MIPIVEQALEYDKVKALLKKYTVSELGDLRVDDLSPSKSLDMIRYELKLCTEVKKFQERSGGLPLSGLADISKTLIHASKTGTILNPEEFLNISKVAQLPNKIKEKTYNQDPTEFPYLFEIVRSLPNFSELVTSINNCISPDGVLLDRASKELRSIRQKLRKIRSNIHNKLDTILRSPDNQKSIQESVITSRNNRFVIPIKQDARAFFNGVVQGQSTSGATYFIEPLSVVEMNNSLHDATEAEQREIRRILLELTDQLREQLPELEQALTLLGDLDFLSAKAYFSQDLNAIEPKINNNGNVNLIKARHPLLEFQTRQNRESINKKNDDFVTQDKKQKPNLPKHVIPTNVQIGRDFNTLVITGPNTGGKTIVLKTVGLLSMMLQSGLHIPAASNSELPIFENIFADIGDDQGIEQNLSTFSSHISKIAEMLKSIEESEPANTLVLLDEIGAGTDPTEGTALGMAILSWLSERDISTIVTTHYGALKAFTHTHDKMENASMEFDSATLRPTYRLRIGVPGSSNALKIAEQLGLPNSILSTAETFFGNNNIAVEDLLMELQETQQEIESKREELQNKIQASDSQHQKYRELIDSFELEQKTIQEQAEKDAFEIITSARKTVDNVVSDIRREQASKASIREAFNKIENAKKQLKPDPPEIPPTKNIPIIHVGDKVRIIRLNRFGEVTAIAKQGPTPIRISVGNMQMNLSFNDIDNVVSKKNTRHLTPSILELQHNKANEIQEELCIHGMLVKEGLDMADKYLDDAYLAGLLTVRILHGKGTGKLRKAVHKALDENPHVGDYKYASPSEGGEGVTVVKFKE
ncbi:endonuclease MutS2 [Candidatus Poribacteria bacterium]|nr:endonuclease MutS2 [Candidatus Poribacteria bacterium]